MPIYVFTTTIIKSNCVDSRMIPDYFAKMIGIILVINCWVRVRVLQDRVAGSDLEQTGAITPKSIDAQAKALEVNRFKSIGQQVKHCLWQLHKNIVQKRYLFLFQLIGKRCPWK